MKHPRIRTPSGIKKVRRSLGVSLEYLETKDGKFYTLNPQTGFVEVPLTSRALTLAIDEAGAPAGWVFEEEVR